MARRAQPSRLRWPLTAPQLDRIDKMFQELYDDTDNGSLEFDANQLTAGTLTVAQGGVGLSTYVVGDILYASATDELSTLAAVATGNALISGGVGVAPSWGKIDLTAHVANTLPVSNGGTGLSTYTVGDLLYASAATTLSKLAAVAAGSVLRAAGVTTAPAWSTFTIPDTIAQGSLIYGSATNVYSALAKDANATRYLSNQGASNSPSWNQVNLANGVTGDLPFANLTQGAALSVLGVTGNAIADVASIAAGTDNNVLRRSGTTLAFGTINLASSNAVTGVLVEANGGTNQSTYAQGDLLYASSANTLAKLAKDTNATRYLSNTGSSNNPAWAQVSLTQGVTGTLPVANGGTNVSSTTQTYTPTLTNVANLDASTAYACQYLRVGNTVIVSGKVDVDPTTPATLTQLGISLPVASALAAAEQVGGTAFASGIAGQGAAVRGDATNDRAEMTWISGDVTNQPMYFVFAYQVL